MTDDSYHPSHGGDTGSPQQPQAEPSLETLRDILFGRYRQQIAELEAELDDLERRVTDEDVLTAMIAPVLGDAIRRKIRDARDEMVEALYPIIGQLVVRSVSVAIRDLVRTIDARMRISFSPQAIWRRLQARLSGVSGAEMVLRESLPFEVAEVFLIHRETGLLLRHVSRDPDASPDSDLISGMLTAIRDFVQDAFHNYSVPHSHSNPFTDTHCHEHLVTDTHCHKHLVIHAHGDSITYIYMYAHPLGYG